ncbi:MAG: TetR/AcrR family transcriptional regulator [bacterium]|nr:TetR/AcrR family transcriptional regulator [bacterium]
MPRPYHSVKRLETVTRTRRRILDSALALIIDEGLCAANIRTIAKSAGFTRPTVYQHFHSLEALLITIFEDEVGRIKEGDLHSTETASLHADPVVALREVLKTWVRVWCRYYEIMRSLEGFFTLRGEKFQPQEELEILQRHQIENLVKRLSAGKLKKGVSQAQAVRTLCLLCSFGTFNQLSNFAAFDHLRRETEPSVREIAATLFSIAQGAVLKEY